MTLVLYFGYEKRWDKPLNLKGIFDIPEAMEPYVNDYRVNMFEIAWLPDETAAMFQSDFRFVADYFIQRWKNQQYKAPDGELKHVREVMELLSAVTRDTRFMDAYNKRIEERGQMNMEAWIDEAENRCREEGENKLGKLIQILLKNGNMRDAHDAAADAGRRQQLYVQYEKVIIARVRTDYVHEQQSRYRTTIQELENRMAGVSASEKVKLTKSLKKFKKQAEELHTYEEKIHHLADQMIEIYLDDGVKKNYTIFQDVLAKIK